MKTMEKILKCWEKHSELHHILDCIKTRTFKFKKSYPILLILTLHKKSRQSLKPSTGRIEWDFFSKIGIEWGTYFSKKVPNFEKVWPTPATPRALTVKGVYVVSHSCYEQLYEPVCNYGHRCFCFIYAKFRVSNDIRITNLPGKTTDSIWKFYYYSHQIGEHALKSWIKKHAWFVTAVKHRFI